MTKKALIFDYDGVIGDTFDLGYKIAKGMFPELTSQQYRDHHNGNPLDEEGNPDKIPFTKEQTDEFFKLSKEKFDPNEHVFTEILPRIERLSRRWDIYLVSSTIDENLNYFLEQTGINQHFQEVLGATTHPSKVVKLNSIGVMGYDLKESYFVTDTLGDLIEANKVGVPSIAVTWGYHPIETLEKGNPDFIANDFIKLERIITKTSP